MNTPTKHILLRDRRHWLGSGGSLGGGNGIGSGTALDRDGGMTLMPVPGPKDGLVIEVPTTYPATREASGLALGSCERVFVADTAHDRVLLVEPQCKSQAWMSGFSQPRGLAFGQTALLVADDGHMRVQSLALPFLEFHWAPVSGVSVSSVALDAKQRLVYVDTTNHTVHRISHHGIPDVAFDTAIAASGRLAAPLFVAIGRQNCVLVSDTTHNQVEQFDADGLSLGALQGPPGWLPGAIAADMQHIYVADASNGHILLFNPAGEYQGALSGWQGPVTALALADNGDLFIKPGLDEVYFQFKAGAAYLPSGQFLAGPFDAGIEQVWERAWIEAQTGSATAIAVEVAQSGSPLPGPMPGDWMSMSGSDALLAPLASPLADRRYLWLRITLTTSDPSVTPVLLQARAATEAEDLRDHLPATYRRNDSTETLKHMLQMVRGEFFDVEEQIDALARLSHPEFATATGLPWLAQWLGLELPAIADDDERRDIIAHAIGLYARRGTPASIADFVEMHTGVRPAIIEEYSHRRLWVLGESSELGFDTQLPPLDPLGMVVPDEQSAQGCCPMSEGEPVIGRAVVGSSGPLASHQIGLPLFAEEAYRFCVVVDAYRVSSEDTLRELCRIVEREKPAHTDYRIDIVAPELRIGLQAMVGVDTIVGGSEPAWRLEERQLGQTAYLVPPDDASRAGETWLDGSLQLN